jgi:hypothetical protein
MYGAQIKALCNINNLLCNEIRNYYNFITLERYETPLAACKNEIDAVFLATHF